MRIAVAATPILLAVLVLAACSRNPFWVHQPEPEKDAEMLYLPDRAGIVVRRVEGVDDARSAALTAALVIALQRANVPAGSGDGAGNQGSQILSTTVAPAAAEGGVRMDMSWTLVDHGGAPVGTGERSRVVPELAWRAATPDTIAGLANEIAPQVAALVQENLGDGVPAGTRQRIHFAGLEGAPGDGAAVLPRLVAYLLDQNGYQAAEASDQDAFSFAGRYQAEPAADGMETIVISWQVMDQAGREIGIVTQENVVPRGTLDGPWGDAAFFIAEGAVQGVQSLLVAQEGPTN